MIFDSNETIVLDTRKVHKFIVSYNGQGVPAFIHEENLNTNVKEFVKKEMNYEDWSQLRHKTFMEHLPDVLLKGSDKTPGDKTPGDKTPGDKTPGDKTPGDKTSGDKTPGDKTPGHEKK